MIKEHYSILFCSLTGNTKKLADAIYETLPKDKCDYFGTNDSQVPQSDVCYIGFWTDKGNADQKTLELLSKLKNKKRFSCLEQLDLVEVMPILKRFSDKVKQSIDASNTVIGEYMCQGKMPQSVRERYVKMKDNPEHPANLDLLIQNFDRALSHPDSEDLERLKKKVIMR